MFFSLMVVRLRLARWGARNNPFFGIIAANQRAPRDGKHLERLGTYNPKPSGTNTKVVELNVERIKYWLSVGAQPSDRVAFILSKANLLPASPKYLHKSGALDINDSKTWDIKLVDSKGMVQGIMDADEARQKFENTPLERDLPKDLSKNTGNSIEYESINFEKLLPVEAQDKRLILKAYLGI